MAKIDKKIEIIDIEMYSLEARDLPSEEDLNSIVEKAQHINKVKNIQDKKYSSFFHPIQLQLNYGQLSKT